MKEYSEEYKYHDYIYRQLAMIINSIDAYMEKYIKILMNHGIYNKPKGYYTRNNKAIADLFEITDMNYKMKSLMWDQMNNMALNQMRDAEFDAYSQVHGNQYGIITNSIAAKVLYGIENEYRIKKSTQKADRQYSASLNRIDEQIQLWFERQWGERFVDYSKNVLASIANITDSLFIQVIDDFIECGILDEETKNMINKEKSNNILNNIELADNKKEVLLVALAADPFNIEVYKKICYYGYLENGIIQFVSQFGMNESVACYIYENINNMIVCGNIDENEFEQNIIYISLLTGEMQEEIKNQVLEETIYDTIEDLCELKNGVSSNDKVEEIYSYLHERNENVDEYIKKNIHISFVGYNKKTMFR